MAKLQFLATLLFAATVLGLASAAKPDSFVVQGKVYCDNCRAGFETTITEYIEGAVVKLTCKNSTTNEIYQEVEVRAAGFSSSGRSRVMATSRSVTL